MAIIKVIRNTYGGTQYIWNLCSYICNSKFIKKSGGTGVCGYDHIRAADEMIRVRKFFHKEKDNPLFPIIIAFDDDLKNEAVAWNYIVNCAYCFLNDYQVFYGMHGKDEECPPHLHGHLLVNSVSYVNGKLFHSDKVIPMFKKCAEKVLGCKCRIIYEDKKNS